MMRIWIILTCALMALPFSGITKADDRPNILFIFVDDLGWADPGCYGHPWHATPNIDRLAESGLRFTDGYASAPICSASRASIQTGKTTARLGFEFVTKNEPGYQKIDIPTKLKAPPFTLNLPLSEVTIAEILGASGYETAFFGKWHLNQHYQRYLGWSPTHGPAKQGYQRAVEDFGAHPYAWNSSKPEECITPGTFPRDTMVEGVCNYLHEKHDRPFFLMASSFYVHTPVKTTCTWLIDKYEKLVPKDSPQRDQRIRYAAFVETLDHYVGQMLTALDESGLKKNTLVVFMSDNGGHPEYTANGPLRGSKWNLYEGGIRVPMIFSWPGRIEAGQTTSTPAIGYDLLPTFADVAGVEPPAVDGISLAPLFDDAKWQPQRSLIWHFPYYHPETGYGKALKEIGVNDFAISKTRPQSALRQGSLKLLLFHETNDVELYDLDNDLSEQKDIASLRPADTERLSNLLRSELKSMNARFPTIQIPESPAE